MRCRCAVARRDQHGPAAGTAADVGADTPAGRQAVPGEDREIAVEDRLALGSGKVRLVLAEGRPLIGKAPGNPGIDISFGSSAHIAPYRDLPRLPASAAGLSKANEVCMSRDPGGKMDCGAGMWSPARGHVNPTAGTKSPSSMPDVGKPSLVITYCNILIF